MARKVWKSCPRNFIARTPAASPPIPTLRGFCCLFQAERHRVQNKRGYFRKSEKRWGSADEVAAPDLERCGKLTQANTPKASVERPNKRMPILLPAERVCLSPRLLPWQLDLHEIPSTEVTGHDELTRPGLHARQASECTNDRGPRSPNVVVTTGYHHSVCCSNLEL